jgi:NTP pyrophosphatase (non-canonical NTP hydrolase)
MNFNQYQEEAIKFAVPLDLFEEEVHGITGLVGEVGEIAEKFKKYVRDKTVISSEDMMKELGDVLWYISYLADLWDVSLDMVAGTNLSKLQSRKDRGVIQGSGDNR